jgi:hypothetical protein
MPHSSSLQSCVEIAFGGAYDSPQHHSRRPNKQPEVAKKA